MFSGKPMCVTVPVVFFLLVAVSIVCISAVSAETLDECYALQAIPKDDPLIVPPTTDEIQICFNRAVVETGDPLDCLSSPAPDVCVLWLADEKKMPSVIKTYADHEFPDYQADRYDEYMADTTGMKQLMVRKRNDLLVKLAGTYLSATGDFSVLDLFDPTYESYYHDQILQSSLSANVASTGFAPRLDYCDNMRGGYLSNYYIKTASETPEGSYASNRQFCEGAVAALRSLLNASDSCETELPGRLQQVLNLSQEEIDQEVAACKGLRADLAAKVENFLEAYAASDGMRLEDLTTKWVLTETRINPNEAKTEFQGGGSMLDFYPEERYEGKLREITVADGSIGIHDRHVDREVVYWDANFTAKFDSPPAMMTSGEDYPLAATTEGSGEAAEAYEGSSSSGIQFEYRAERIAVGGDTQAATFLGFVTDRAFATYTAPIASIGAEEIIHAFLWNCPACLVDYVYTGKKFEAIQILLLEAQAQPMNIGQLDDYFDVSLDLSHVILNMGILAGVPASEDGPRSVDYTGDGKAGIKDTIATLRSLTK